MRVGGVQGWARATGRQVRSCRRGRALCRELCSEEARPQGGWWGWGGGEEDWEVRAKEGDGGKGGEGGGSLVCCRRQ